MTLRPRSRPNALPGCSAQQHQLFANFWRRQQVHAGAWVKIVVEADASVLGKVELEEMVRRRWAEYRLGGPLHERVGEDCTSASRCSGLSRGKSLS